MHLYRVKSVYEVMKSIYKGMKFIYDQYFLCMLKINLKTIRIFWRPVGLRDTILLVIWECGSLGMLASRLWHRHSNCMHFYTC